MKKQFSIFLLIFFVSSNINAEISGVSIHDLTQLYKEQIAKILVGNKLFSNFNFSQKMLNSTLKSFKKT